MKKYIKVWQNLIYNTLKEMIPQPGEQKISIAPEFIIAETPPRPELGDIAFPMFLFAKTFKQAPYLIAEKVAAILSQTPEGKAEAAGPYVNIKLNREVVCSDVLTNIIRNENTYGELSELEGEKIMVEFSCPNTNKPLHLGHLRNDAIGQSVSNILKANGAEIKKVNLINDRGIHICKSMLAYKKFGKGRTPAEEQLKSDHFVGKYYVAFSTWAKEDPKAEEEARNMLMAWEKGDEEVIDLWNTMNAWAIDGIKTTYKNTGISFDSYYYESKTYMSGKEEILKGLKENIFYKKEDGSIWVDLTKKGLDNKVLLRGDGTSLYITQDIGTAMLRHSDWPFDRLIYVVASEQNYHFQVLFHVLKMLKKPWADHLFHLSYGMVNLLHGKMKSREGTVVDADTLLEELILLAENEIRERERENEIENIRTTSEQIALGALNYFLLSTTPGKDMIFIPEESISFNGNTGPYLQYTGARISSILNKFEERKDFFKNGTIKYDLLTVDEEWEIIKLLLSFPENLISAGKELNPSYIAIFLYELTKHFSRYYHENPILHNENPDLVVSRIELLKAVRIVLKKGFSLLNIPFLEKM
ncbi:MAG: arginine--tRNA ligase [Spirochaetales bacterium]|nr:arginine--tRNA ligase [Spirochaetales bacterium]